MHARELPSPGAAGGAARLLSCLRLIHPFPTLMNTFAVGGLAALATHGAVPIWTVAHLMLAMLAIQSSIGIVNDLRDRELDARSKPSKPLVRGTIGVGGATAAAAAMLVAAVLLAGGFGLAAWLLAMAGLASGLLYDLWLKRTPASVLPYAIGLPLLPLWVWTATGSFCNALYGVIPLGLLLGLALHLANSLPDFDEDARACVTGLAHRLGPHHALAVCWGSYALSVAAVAASAAAVSYTLVVLLPGLAVAGGSLLGAVAVYGLSPERSSLQAGWMLLVVGTAALALGWLGALPSC